MRKRRQGDLLDRYWKEPQVALCLVRKPFLNFTENEYLSVALLLIYPTPGFTCVVSRFVFVAACRSQGCPS
jgi:hypothetical protein